MELLIGFVLFILFIVFSIVVDKRLEKKDKAETEAAAKQWFQQQLERPSFKIVVKTKNGKMYESKFFKPKYEIIRYFSWTYFSYTSKELALNQIESSFKNGRFYHDKSDTYIPMCDIKTINVVEAKDA